jgi:putative transposase
VSLPQAHLVFVTKYRRDVFTDAMLTICEHTIRTVCDELAVEFIESNRDTDYIHSCPFHPPRPSTPWSNGSKTAPANAVRREFTSACARARMLRHPWSPPYSAVSCTGAPLSIINQYIGDQARPP